MCTHAFGLRAVLIPEKYRMLQSARVSDKKISVNSVNIVRFRQLTADRELRFQEKGSKQGTVCLSPFLRILVPATAWLLYLCNPCKSVLSIPRFNVRAIIT